MENDGKICCPLYDKLHVKVKVTLEEATKAHKLCYISTLPLILALDGVCC